MFASIERKEPRAWGECCLRGLMLDRHGESVRPMADCLPNGNMQAPQQFPTSFLRDHTPVPHRVATKVSQALDPDTWVIATPPSPKRELKSVDTDLGAAAAHVMEKTPPRSRGSDPGLRPGG